MNQIIQELKEHAKSTVLLLSTAEGIGASTLIELSGCIDACDRANKAQRRFEKECESEALEIGVAQ